MAGVAAPRSADRAVARHGLTATEPDNRASHLTGDPDIFGPARSDAQTFRTRLGHLIAHGVAGTAATVDGMERAVNSRACTAELFKARTLARVCSVRSIAVEADPQTGESCHPAIS